MSYATEINTVMISDASLNSMVGGGIYCENLPDNWLGNTDYNEWIVHESNITENVATLSDKNIYSNYSLKVIVIQRNTNDQIENITNRLIDYLNAYDTSTMLDITFLNDVSGFDKEKSVYTNTLEFSIIYM